MKEVPVFESFYLEYQKQWDSQREMTNIMCIYKREKKKQPAPVSAILILLVKT